MSKPRPLPSLPVLFALLVLALPHAVRGQQPASAFLRRPDIHGDQVVFTAEGDLWLASVKEKTARRLTTHAGLESSAHFSPDGKLLAFTGQYDGSVDIYVMPAEGGSPRRLTFGNAGTTEGWTPDGKNVLFRSRRENPEGKNRLWSVPVEGGMPRWVPIPQVEFAAFHADGHRVAYVPVSGEWQHWKRYQGGQADDVWLADLTAKSFKKLTDFAGVDTAPVWVGDRIYFVSERNEVANLYRMEATGEKPTAVTHYADYDVRYPATDGHRVVFEYGNGIALYDPKDNETRVLEFALGSERVHARPRRVPVQTAVNNGGIGPSGKRVVLEARGQLLTVPAESGDFRMIAPLPGSRSQFPAWSPDGKWIAFVSDRSGEDQIWVAPAAGAGAPRQVTRDHLGPLGELVWSPDSKLIAVGDRELRVMLADVESGALTQVDQAERGGSYDTTNYSYRFSPDSRWLAYNKTIANQNDVVYLYEIGTRKKLAVTSPEMNCYGPSFDPTGKYLAFLADRSYSPQDSGATRFWSVQKTTRVSLVTLSADTPSPFLLTNDEEPVAVPTPKPEPPATAEAAPAVAGGEKPAVPASQLIKVDPEGLPERVIDVPVPADRYAAVVALEGRLLLHAVLDAGEAAGGLPGQLRSFDFKRKDVTLLANHISGFDLSTNRKKLLLQSGRELQVVDPGPAPIAAGTGRVDLAGLSLQVDPAAEWKQIFAESWRIGRDFFYDPGLHGVDWEAVRRKYAAMLPAVGDRNDLNFVLGEMIAELNTGHAYVGGGDVALPPQTPMGYLGADFAPAPEGNAFRVVHLLRGDQFDLAARSPLLGPGINVKEGDYILAIGGQPVATNQDIQALLIGTPGRVISVMVNSKPTLEGAREVQVRPLAGEGAARYYDWVAGRREYVRTHGGENLGYLHIPDMTNRGLQEFAKHYYANLQKDGMVYDVRNNGGGYISAMLLLQMSGKPYAYFKPRFGPSWTRQDWAFSGYSVALCNENSGSNAEEFSDAFQRLKLGPVIGVRTWGGEVGSGGGYALIDGGRLNIPNYGAWTPDGKWIIEGTGVQPDVTVENDPAAVMAGADTQLDRAIAYLKERIQAQPVTRPLPPPFPNKARHPVKVGK